MVTLTINRARRDSVYEQIAGQIRQLVASGTLRPGAPLPPVRQLAGDLGVNLNTVARAYRLLGAEGFLAIRDRSGVTVAAPSGRVEHGVREELTAQLRTTLARLRQAGLGQDELADLVGREIRALNAIEREHCDEPD
jgi:GntR family transcriptional regulator